MCWYKQFLQAINIAKHIEYFAKKLPKKHRIQFYICVLITFTALLAGVCIGILALVNRYIPASFSWATNFLVGIIIFAVIFFFIKTL